MGGNRGEATRDAATYYTPGKWQDGQREKVYRGTREGGGSGGCRSGSGKGIFVVVVVVDVVIVVVDFIVVVVVDVITDENKNAHFLQASYDICGTTCSLVSSWLSDSACVRPSLTCYRSDMYYLTRVTGKEGISLNENCWTHTHTQQNRNNSLIIFHCHDNGWSTTTTTTTLISIVLSIA